jgi:uncharacterized protein YqjF (DUF2071 family)
MSSPFPHNPSRPYPPPDSAWVMAQSWHDLLFMHWPVPVAELQRAMPPKLQVDTFEGQAYIGVVPFRMSGVRPRFLPPVPGISAFPELNVRTYVTLDGRPGVYFFSLDAGNKLAVRVARPLFHLPYYDANMSLLRAGDDIVYDSERTHEGAAPATLHARYRPVGPIELARPGSLEAWLTARYCMYPVDAAGNVYRGEIDHAPWLLQPATAEIARCTMTEPHHIQLSGPPPLLHFSQSLDVVVWPLQQLLL